MRRKRYGYNRVMFLSNLGWRWKYRPYWWKIKQNREAQIA